MKFAELHYFADPRFVVDGYTTFLWSTESDQPFAPAFPPAFGIAVAFDDAQDFPETFSRYNPETGQWTTPLALDYVPELEPYNTAVWNGDAWTIADAPPGGGS